MVELEVGPDTVTGDRASVLTGEVVAVEAPLGELPPESWIEGAVAGGRNIDGKS